MISWIDQFLLYIATEKGLSSAYQLSVRQSLEALVGYLEEKGEIRGWQDVGMEDLTAFLAVQKKAGLSASSLRISMVHWKIFFRFLVARQVTLVDPAEPLLPPNGCLLYTSPSPRDLSTSRMPSSA